MKFRIITGENCTYCKAAKQLLAFKGYEYEEVDVNNVREEMQMKGFRSIPQVFLEDGTHIGGFESLVGFLS